MKKIIASMLIITISFQLITSIVYAEEETNGKFDSRVQESPGYEEEKKGSDE